MKFRARGFEGEIWGGNRGFVSIGLKLSWFEKWTSYQQRPGRKFLDVDRRGIKHENKIIVGFPLWIFAPGVSKGRFGVEIVVLYMLAQNSFDSKENFLPAASQRKGCWRWRWINDEVEYTSIDIEAVIVKTIHVRMVKSWGDDECQDTASRYSFKIHCKDDMS